MKIPKCVLDPSDQEELPKINIAGRTWAIPVLSPRQNRRVVPRIMKLGKINPQDMSESDIDDLYEIIFWALTRAYPEVDQKDFMDWPINLPEAIAAIPVIAQQTGVMKQEGDEGPTTAATAESPLIGTTSSPE
jgi:hypothetical protein